VLYNLVVHDNKANIHQTMRNANNFKNNVP